MSQSQLLQEIVEEEVVRRIPAPEYSEIDSAFMFLSKSKDSGKIKDKNEKKETELDLETEVDIAKTQKDHDSASVDHLLLNERMMEILSYHEKMIQDSLYRSIVRPEEEEYKLPRPVTDDNAEEHDSLTEEVLEEIQDLKYDFLNPEKDPRKMRQLIMYMALHPAEFAFYESLLSLNRDSVYVYS